MAITSTALFAPNETWRFCSVLLLIGGVFCELFNTHYEHFQAANHREQQLQHELETARRDFQKLQHEVNRQNSTLNDAHLSFLANLSHELRTSMNGGEFAVMTFTSRMFVADQPQFQE